MISLAGAQGGDVCLWHKADIPVPSPALFVTLGDRLNVLALIDRSVFCWAGYAATRDWRRTNPRPMVRVERS